MGGDRFSRQGEVMMDTKELTIHELEETPEV
jgi:hypothetical protein